MTYSSEVLADSPVVYWRQGDASGSTMADSSGNSRPASYVNSPTLGATGALYGDSDTAVTYNGTNQYGIVASAGAADTALKAISGAFSLECWVKLSSLTSNRGLFDRYGGGGATESSYLFYLVSGKPTFIVRNAGNSDTTLQAASALSSGTWTHLVATYDGTNMRIYVNGSLVGSPQASTFSSHNRSTLLNIGRFVFSSGHYAGDLDEVAVYGSALSATRISDHYNAALPNPNATVNAPAATATAAALSPTVAAGSSVTAVTATATSLALPPVVTGSADVAISAVPATATASALPPSLVVDSAVLAVAATAIAGASAPAVSGAASVAAVPATATALALPPVVSDGTGDVSILAVPATATATALAPVWTQVLSATTDTSNDLGGIRLEGSGTATVTRPVTAPPATTVLATRVDKAAAYPTPTMVNGRPT